MARDKDNIWVTDKDAGIRLGRFLFCFFVSICMLGYLTILATIAVIPAIAVLIFTIKEKKHETAKYTLTGITVALIDFICEYAGISLGRWHYEASVYFINRLVPLELFLIFFSCGILLRFAFFKIPKVKIPMKLDFILFIITIFGVIAYLQELHLGLHTTSLLFAVPMGIWGILNIPDKQKGTAFAIALAIAMFDFIVETIILQTGGYVYRYGFSLRTPLMYAMFTLGILGIMEKLRKK